eukprot:m.108309 g.108309  ORF g.108309 m.108309 type:complete len:132 (+) comp13341_c1_seq2:283-678(+)
MYSSIAHSLATFIVVLYTCNVSCCWLSDSWVTFSFDAAGYPTIATPRPRYHRSVQYFYLVAMEGMSSTEAERTRKVREIEQLQATLQDLDQRIQGVQQENQELKLKSKKLTVCIEEFVAAAPPSTTDPDKP